MKTILYAFISQVGTYSVFFVESAGDGIPKSTGCHFGYDFDTLFKYCPKEGMHVLDFRNTDSDVVASFICHTKSPDESGSPEEVPAYLDKAKKAGINVWELKPTGRTLPAISPKYFASMKKKQVD